MVSVGGIWSMVRIPPWGNVRYNASLGGWSALGGAHLWTLCLHTWWMLRDTIYGEWVVVIARSSDSSSHNLAVRGEHQENGACTRAMHAKRLPNKVHNHAMARDDNVCSYFFQVAATAIKTVFCDCAKQSY